jgi:hypothetical protein
MELAGAPAGAAAAPAGDGASADSAQPAMAPTLGIVGFGDPVLDIISNVPLETLRRLGAEPGGCLAVSLAELQQLLSLEEVQRRPLR